MQGHVLGDDPKLHARHDAKMNAMRVAGGCDPFATPFGAARDDPLTALAGGADSKIFSRAWSGASTIVGSTMSESMSGSGLRDKV
jgi:hypothetical protein